MPSLLARHGFSASEIQSLVENEILRGGLQLYPFAKYAVVSVGQKRHFVRVFHSQKGKSFSFWRDERRVGIELSESEFEIKVRTISGTVKNSLYSSLQREVSDGALVRRFLNAYIMDYDFKKIKIQGSHFIISFEEIYDRGQFVGHGEVLFASLEIQSHLVERTFVKFEGGGSFLLNESDQSEKPFYSPVDYVNVSSLFNLRRYHPVRHRRRPHLGIDLALPRGQGVYSAQAGIVTAVGRSRAGGRYVRVEHADGFQTAYEHLNSIEPVIEKGLIIQAGEKLGEIGCSGYCTGPHLHFAIRKDGRFIDPSFLMKTFPYNHQAAFVSTVEE